MRLVASLADVTDVSTVYGELSALQSAQVTAWLARLSAMVRLRFPTIDARVTASTDLGVLMRGVLVDAVLRVLRNPDGKVSESIDDYTYRRSDTVADGSLYLTDAEWALLEPVTPGASPASGAFTIRPGGTAPPAARVWW